VGAVDERVRDAIIVGAGPGGLQAAIYLGRFNRDVLVLDRGGGRTLHARSIENFLTHTSISGREIVERGTAQARSFNVSVERATVESIARGEVFEVRAEGVRHLSRFVIAASGVSDNLPPIEGVHRFLGAGFYTCVDCDGHKTTGRKLVIIGESLKTIDLAVAMKKMFTKDITVVLYFRQPPEAYREVLAEEGIALMNARPVRILGAARVEGLELEGGKTIECEAIMSHFGFKLNDGYLDGLGLKRDARGFAYRVGSTFESSMDGLYIVGPLNTGNDQAIIAAGEGAVAAIAINKRLLES
jgi:thioredoxin reductase (NADPH)